MNQEDVSQASMLDLFRLEADEQVQSLTAGLLALERDPAAPLHLESCMRAAHSLKGAARIAGVEAGVNVAHTMENSFVAAQRGRALDRAHVDVLLRALDLLRRIAQTPESVLERWQSELPEVAQCIAALQAVQERGAERNDAATAPAAAAVPAPPALLDPVPPPAADKVSAAAEAPGEDRVLRVTMQHLNRLLGLAGESLVESRRLKPFAESLLRLKRQHAELAASLQRLRETLPAAEAGGGPAAALAEAERHAAECRRLLVQRMTELDSFERRADQLSARIYDGTLACRMRPFSDVTRGLPRMVRDLARRLGKQVRLEIEGAAIEVDRDILQKLEAPLGHLLRNAVDHGIEAADRRQAVGKDAEGVVRVSARLLAGQLSVLVADDGAGIDLEQLRSAVLSRGLANLQTAARLTAAELYQFLLLPGFTLAASLTDISGRGVGLDAVHTMLQQLRGSLRISSQPRAGTQCELQVPLTLSLVRAILVEVGGEPYALPLAASVRALRVPRTGIAPLEGRPHVAVGERRIGLISAHQIFECAPPPPGPECSVVIVGSGEQLYGLVVDRLLGERELVVQPLDPRLGKLRNLSAGALLEDGSPVLIVDGEDLLRSIERLVASDGVRALPAAGAAAPRGRRRRVLVVDDSLTVRELERKLLVNAGYEVEVAVDGMDGWNAIRGQPFDLVITDVDMPRADGIELVTLIRADARLQSLPVMIVSYKDRPEDRQRGLAAGADHYLAKSGFHDQLLLQAVADLIGEALA
jgi:two-component system sensor histidine kinase and response regulator WspE